MLMIDRMVEKMWLRMNHSRLTMSSVERDGPILPIDRTGFSGFWSKTLWMRFLQGAVVRLM